MYRNLKNIYTCQYPKAELFSWVGKHGVSETLQHSLGTFNKQELVNGTEGTYLDTCSQRGALGLTSLKATSISALILSKAIASSRGHRLAEELRSPSSAAPLCSSFNPSETGPLAPSSMRRFSVEGPGFSGKVGIWSMSLTELQLRNSGLVAKKNSEIRKRKKGVNLIRRVLGEALEVVVVVVPGRQSHSSTMAFFIQLNNPTFNCN